MSNQNHIANRSKTDLSKQVKHNTPSAQRSLKSATNVVDKAASAVESVASSAVGSLTSSAGNDFGAKSAQTLASAASTGGRVVSTSLRTSVNVVAKVPAAVQRMRFDTNRHVRRAKQYTLRRMTLRQRFRPKVKSFGRAIGGGLSVGSRLAGGASAGLQKAVGSGEGTGSSAMGLALQSGQAMAAGARAIKTGTVATGRALKTTGRIVTRVERKIVNGVARRSLKTSARASARAAEEAAKASLKMSQQVAKLAAKFMQNLEMATARLLSLILSNAPFSLVVIGVIILIILGGGMFMMVAMKK